MKKYTLPLNDKIVNELNVGDQLLISGDIYTGRDAVLPLITQLIENNLLNNYEINLQGSLIFHTAVSVAGIGPTTSNKLEIEESIPALSKAGVKIHLGKGALKRETIQALDKYNSIYAVIPPVTALLESKIIDKKVIAFSELGMEAFYQIKVKEIPIIVAAIHGKSIYDKKSEELKYE